MFINVDLLSFLRSRQQVGYILVSETTPLRFLHQHPTHHTGTRVLIRFVGSGVVLEDAA